MNPKEIKNLTKPITNKENESVIKTFQQRKAQDQKISRHILPNILRINTNSPETLTKN